MKKLGGLAALILLLAMASATFASNGSDKVFVCKYVGTPGVNETLQTGQNPISVSVNAIIEDPVVIGSFFADAQGRSFVLAWDTGQDEPDASECPTPGATPTPTLTPTETPNTPPTPTPTATLTETPTPTPVTVATPTPTIPAGVLGATNTPPNTATDSATGPTSARDALPLVLLILVFVALLASALYPRRKSR